MTSAVPSHPVPSPFGTMGKLAKRARVRSTLSPRLTVKITVPSSPASSTVRQSPGCREPWHRGVEKQLNQTWVSSYRTNASSAFFFFSALQEKGQREGVRKERGRKILQKRAKTFLFNAWAAKGLRWTLVQFRAFFFPSDSLKPGVRHVLRPLTPRFTSPPNYLCASHPPKDNVTICLFNCLSVTPLWALSGGVHAFLFHLYLFIYLAWRGGGCLVPETGSLCLGWFHMDIAHCHPPPPSSLLPPCSCLPSTQFSIVRPSRFVWGLIFRVIVHSISITTDHSMRLLFAVERWSAF